ncbi:MAG: FAD-dependent oxidoreductase, partial [Candidatus Dadabacteria bacterium]|nr:FAD-dependent oxidoreductase [Candidatus Dadabacteria bacterium]
EIDGKVVMTSDEAIMHTEGPRSIVVIGGGYIGMEFAYVYNSFGSKVTIVEMEKQIMPGTDEEVAKEAKKIFSRQGMTILNETVYKSFRKTRGSATVTVENVVSGEQSKIKADMVLVSIGRRAVANAAPTSFAFYGTGDSIGLEDVGIDLDERGFIKTDKNYMTTCSNIYAIGDVIGGPMLAHKASEEGVVAVEKMNGLDSRVHYSSIPGCVYCQPEVAMIGLTEKQARDKGYDVDIGKFPFRAVGKAVAVGETDGFVKMIFDSKTKELLGSHIIGHGATEMIAEIGVAKTLETTPYEIATTQHAHPTLSEAVMEAALDAMGRVRNF